MLFKSTIRPIIEGKVGNKTAYFLLDTGAALPLIDSSQIEKYSLVKGYKFPGNIIGTGGIAQEPYYCNSEININGKILKNFILIDMSSVKNSILRDTGLEILGLISYSQIKELEITINPSKNEIYGI